MPYKPYDTTKNKVRKLHTENNKQQEKISKLKKIQLDYKSMTFKQRMYTYSEEVTISYNGYYGAYRYLFNIGFKHLPQWLLPFVKVAYVVDPTRSGFSENTPEPESYRIITSQYWKQETNDYTLKCLFEVDNFTSSVIAKIIISIVNPIDKYSEK